MKIRCHEKLKLQNGKTQKPAKNLSIQAFWSVFCVHAFHPSLSSFHCGSIVWNRQDAPVLPSCGVLAPVEYKQPEYKKPERAHTLTLLKMFLESLGHVVKNYQSNQNNPWYKQTVKKNKKIVLSSCNFFSLQQACTTNPTTQARTCTAY